MTKTEKERAFFNEKAATWDQQVVHKPEKISTILDAIGIQKGDKILDVGCGTGVLTPYLLEKLQGKGWILAMDLAEEMIKRAKEKYSDPQVEYRRGNVLEDLGDETFHHIICYSMFPHFENKEQAIHQMKKHLKAKGTLTIAHSNSREEINGIHEKQATTIVAEDRLPSEETLVAFGKKAGLEKEQVIDSSEYFMVMLRNT
ncbi:demethylmenaquinone methyltransferase / 2-methoxy-6-polyprenyl-1,4-benzoquinol methylase [Tindallia magadiensis]|uniref:Demethylmenaquinone methyltransferase / 2-methoxy-6-polyprenyl-1,4-benzoquinol methylase n=1 Tax=Tindallia magadiensis TaxID=69895 RepID=A0A1I3GVD7_9FIRM|nr:class I SAM-dependent methyltransferase [Tindallia magadiensis]SFI27302.1 demethylmenaquinone methyltransferase / 2-methoxy-6-polyprenyl-1,4-benzoquinol methylase [Tindallia magadiensis]